MTSPLSKCHGKWWVRTAAAYSSFMWTVRGFQIHYRYNRTAFDRLRPDSGLCGLSTE